MGAKNFLQLINSAKNCKAFIGTMSYQLAGLPIIKALKSPYNKNCIELITSDGTSIYLQKEKIPKPIKDEDWLVYEIDSLNIMVLT